MSAVLLACRVVRLQVAALNRALATWRRWSYSARGTSVCSGPRVRRYGPVCVPVVEAEFEFNLLNPESHTLALLWPSKPSRRESRRRRRRSRMFRACATDVGQDSNTLAAPASVASKLLKPTFSHSSSSFERIRITRPVADASLRAAGGGRAPTPTIHR